MATENVEVVYSADVAGYTRSLGEAIAVTEQYSKATGGLSGSLNNLATVMSTKMLTAARGFSGANQTLAGQAAAYQQALAPLEATTVTTGESFKKLSEDTRRLGREFPIGITNAVQSMRQLQQLGASQRMMSDLATSMTELAGATGSAVPAVTLEMTQLSRTFGNFNPRSISGMADSLVSVTSKFGGSAQSVLQFSNAIAPLAKQAGMSQASVMGFATAFSRLGEDGYRSANAFNKMLIDMDRSIREGSDTMRVYANTVGMTVEEFQKMFKLDPSSALTSVIEGLNKQGPGAIRTLEQMGLEGTRTLSSITNLVQSGNLREIQDEALSAYGSGASKEAAEAAFGGLNDQLTMLNETLSQVGAQAGRPFLSFMEKAASGATSLAGAFDSVLNNRFVQFLIGGAGLLGGAAAIGAKAGGTMLAGGGILQLLGMGAKDGQPNALVRGLSSTAGKVGMVGAAGAFGLAQLTGAGGTDVPWGLLSLGALGLYGRYGRGRGAGAAAAGTRGALDMFVTGPAMAAANPRGALRGEINYSSVTDEQRYQRTLLDAERDRMRAAGTPMSRWEYARNRMDIATDPSAATRSQSTWGAARRAAGRAAVGVPMMALSGAGMVARSTLGMIGGGIGAGIAVGATALGTAQQNVANAEQGRAAYAADSLAGLNEFRNATGRATEAAASLAAEQATQTAAIKEVVAANQTLTQATSLAAGELAKLADWDLAMPEQLLRGGSEQVASQVMALTTGNPEDIALALQDVAKRRGEGFASEVGGIISSRGTGAEAMRGAAMDLLTSPGKAEFGGAMSVFNFANGPGDLVDLLKGAEQGVEVGGIAGQVFGEEQRRAEEMGGVGARLETQDRQVREVVGLAEELSKEQGLLSEVQASAMRTALETAGVDPELAGRMINEAAKTFGPGNRTESAQTALDLWEETQGSVYGAMEGAVRQRGTAAERRIRGDVGIGFSTAGGYPSGSIAADELFGFMDKLRAANVDLTDAVEANTKGQVDLTDAELDIINALNQPESAAAVLGAAEATTSRLSERGLTLQEQESELNRLINVGDYAEGDPRLIQMQQARGRVQMLRGIQQQRMGRGERWQQAREDWAQWQERGREGLSESQIGEYQAAEQRAMAAEEEERQFKLSRIKAQEELNFSLARAAESFGRQQGYQRADFLRGLERQERDYQVQVERMTFDFYLGQDRAREDYQISRARSEDDFYRNRARSVEDFNRSMQREAADHQRAMERMAVDTARSMADPYQRIFGQATYSPQGLASNLKEQERLFREQMDTLDDLRKRGLSQQAIDVLGLAEAGNAQQAISLGEGSRADLRRLNRLANRRVGLGGEFRDESLSFRRSEEDRTIGLQRQRADMRRNLRRSDADFRRSLERGDADFARSLDRQNADFARSLARSEADYLLAIDRANEDFLISSSRAFSEFQIQMAQAQEDLERSFRDINGDMKDVNKAYRRFIRGETNLLEGLITDTDTKVAESAKANVDLLSPPDSKEYKQNWKRFAEDIKDGLSEAGFDLGGGVSIFLSTTGGGGGGGATAPPTGGGRGWGGVASGGSGISSPFGMRRHPVTGQYKLHTGTDYGSATDVFSPFFGQVLGAGWYSGYGPGLVLKSMHEPVALFYGHLNTGDLAEVGSVVAPGDKVGSTYPGAIGSSTGQHLHLEVLKDPYRPYTDAVSPEGWLKYGGIAQRPHSVKVGEHGPEAVIPLDERGLSFMTQSLKEVARHVDGVAVGASQAASYSNTTVYNNQQYAYDQSTRFTGPMTVVANDPADLANKAASRARRDRALEGRA